MSDDDKATEQLEGDAVEAAEDVGEAAAAAAVEGAATGGAVGAESAALDAIESEGAKVLPPLEHEAWDALKAWVRKELRLAAGGTSEQTRQAANP